jgi:hypothetical protein
MTPDDLLVDDYKLKVDFLKAQFDRLWNRFNYFLGVEMALFGVLGLVVFDEKKVGAVRSIGGLGLLVSLLWYVVGAQDRAVVEQYRARVERAAQRIANRPELAGAWDAGDHAAVPPSDVCNGPLSWYAQHISVTKLPALLALGVFCPLWLAITVFGRNLFKCLGWL